MGTQCLRSHGKLNPVTESSPSHKSLSLSRSEFGFGQRATPRNPRTEIERNEVYVGQWQLPSL